MASALDICNAALAHIGQRTIVASIDPPEQSTEAEYCALFWPLVRDEALASHTWSFATVRAVLADLTASSAPPAAYEYSYGLPAECLKFIGVRASLAEDDTINKNCRLGSDGTRTLIYTDVEDAVGVYVSRVTNATRYQPLLVRALEFMLAARLAPPIIKGFDGMRVGDVFDKKAEAALAKAQTADANQTRERDVTDPQIHKPSHLEGRGYATVEPSKIVRS